MATHSRYSGVAYAVVRVDLPIRPESDLRIAITVKEIVPTHEVAEAEVARLMALNADKSIVYFWQHTRVLSAAVLPPPDA